MRLFIICTLILVLPSWFSFSCKARYFYPSCHQKRMLAFGEWVEANVLSPVPHPQYVSTVPKDISWDPAQRSGSAHKRKDRQHCALQ